MLNIQRFTVNMIRENCYIVSDSTNECCIIDCGAYYEEERKAISEYIKRNNLKPVHLLSTHGHLDHNFGNNTIFDNFNIKSEVSYKDEFLMNDLKGQGKAMFGLGMQYEFPTPGHYFEENESISFGTHKFQVIETPGHTPGSVAFYCKEENIAFTGDTLFRQSVGRTDFKGGSMFMLINSLRNLAQLPDETRILPGHGEETSIGWELAHNPYMDR